MNVSDRGVAFIAAHEGFVSRGYLDPVGIVTIGYGFTMRSRIFADWWRRMHGRALAVGDHLSREQANKLLLKLLDREYAPPVRRALPHLTQNQFDACVSVVYNLGAKALTWRWAQALKAGNIVEAATLLRQTGTTASGRRLEGLVRRRADEARLLESGNYGSKANTTAPQNCQNIKQLQQNLKFLGFNPGGLDGLWGARTKAAVIAFQQANPPLVVDGKAGPATRAAVRRALASRNGTGLVGVVTLVTGSGLFAGNVPIPMMILGVLALLSAVCAGVHLWRNRGAVLLNMRQMLKRA